ncbi:MAG: phosphate-starvation-inducible PsiE family protein [Anaerolineaceae bacterium]|nr:phosphate-starvation-inducible PsiE family protein [Anaerolineaceae bacterium]
MMHIEVVLEVALIAVARKVIIVDVKEFPSGTLLGIAAVVVALSIAFFVVKRNRTRAVTDAENGANSKHSRRSNVEPYLCL